MSSSNTVLPCPFCGSRDVSVQEGDTFRWRLTVCNGCNAKAPDVRIQTSGSGTPDEWQERGVAAALAEWNKRAAAEPSAHCHLHTEAKLGCGKCIELYIASWQPAHGPGKLLSEPPSDLRLRQLENLRTLKPGWDSYGAVPIDPACIDKAGELLRALPGDWTPVPVSDGTVQLESHSDGFDLTLDITPCASVTKSEPCPHGKPSELECIACNYAHQPKLRDDDRSKPADETNERQCTCHPDDKPPRPCPKKYALTECRQAAGACHHCGYLRDHSEHCPYWKESPVEGAS